MSTILRKLTNAAIAAGLVVTSSSALADGHKTYEVTITNITNAIIFTPILVASHKKGLAPLFELGSPASDGMTAIAEGGNIVPLATTLGANPDVVDVKNSGALPPGHSVTVTVSAENGAKHISVASMMLPTNDGFIGLNGVKAPKKGTAIYYSPGYDAGSEFNDEWCVNIPGPQCAIVNGGYMGEGFSDPDETDEGYVHINRGIQENGDLLSATYDWRNPVAKITITLVK
ncbi:MAG: spondin domain-containing protein [Gammaproteobacteria bacterium]